MDSFMVSSWTLKYCKKKESSHSILVVHMSKAML